MRKYRMSMEDKLTFYLFSRELQYLWIHFLFLYLTVRPVQDKQVKTCIIVKFREYELNTLLDTDSK